METNNMNIVNVGPVLEDLLTTIKKEAIPEYIYLNQAATALHRNALGIMEDTLPKILQLLGIRSLMVNSSYDYTPLKTLHVDIPENTTEEYLWPHLRKDEIIRELQSVFRNCRMVGFDNWSAISSASSVWDGLLSDVIKPLERNDLEFLFYLGDPVEKLSFQVGEALDIVSDFSLQGQVTFALDEGEAINLWKMLNGVGKDVSLGEQTYVDLRKKYFSIFRTMDIARVLIYSASNALVFTAKEQFVITRKIVDHEIEAAPDARLNYIVGFSTGLALQLSMAHCIALGLIVFGAQGERKASPKKEDLVKYTEEWIADLQKTATINLYGE
ncbi:hypothetical protein [Chitinophaga ginsengisoli]|uniref:Uncharacterized protein n=1 Tax=Chitinophaga ginsengisoli TaxID=363837 RepID=A0A2P8GAL6_9BACT|nr:hypothetical protein [Chitinophaga ginsengisoli]PSL30988.1 hypothetical protein CLV42_105351 [Chitinophaga ginsengisoli]